MQRIYLALFLVLVVVLVGCAPASTPTPPSVSIDLAALAADYPTVDGSTSALPLQTWVACQIHQIPCRWYEVGDEAFFFLFERTTRNIGPEMDFFENDPPAVNPVTTISHRGTHGAYLNLISGEADIILVARQPSDDEYLLAQQQGVDLDVRPVALDAFVFLAHQDNPIDDLSLDTIRAIYTGAENSWAAAGGADQPISAYQRNANSGSQELMNRLVMDGAQMIDSPDMILPSMMGPINAISSDPLGLGYSVFFYAEFIFPNPEIKLLAIEGVAPTSATIADQSYPLTAEVYVVVRGDLPADSSALMLRDWLLSAAGQAVVAASGYVPLP